MKSIVVSSVSLLVLGSALSLRAQSPEAFFVAGGTNYLRTNIDEAKRFVTNGLARYPGNPKLTNLWELLNRSQQQQSQNNQDQDQQKQDQQKQNEKSDQEKKQDEQKSEQQKKDDASKEQQQKQDQQDAKKPEDKQDQSEQQQSAQDQRGEKPDKASQAAQYNRVMAMSPQQASQLLEAQKAEEKAMIFLPQPTTRTNKPANRVLKDW
jgi:outer membrane biosynthesis protein TonB